MTVFGQKLQVAVSKAGLVEKLKARAISARAFSTQGLSRPIEFKYSNHGGSKVLDSITGAMDKQALAFDRKMVRSRRIHVQHDVTDSVVRCGVCGRNHYTSDCKKKV